MKLSDVAIFIRGVTFEKSDQEAIFNDFNVPLLRSGNISEELNIKNDLVYVPSSIVSKEQMLRKGDIVICLSSGSPQVVGKSAPLEQDWKGTVGGFCGIIRPRDSINAQYLALWMRSPAFIRWRDEQARGANIQNLRFSELGFLEIALPYENEQHRIAAQLKAQLAAVEEARQAAQARQAEFAKLRQAVFAQVFPEMPPISGTETQSTISQEVSLLNGGEAICQLRDVAEIVAGITLGRKTKDTQLTSVPYLRVANVQDGRLDLREVKYVEATKSEIAKWQLQKGDILLTEGGDPDKLGRGSYWREELPLCIHQNHIYRVRFDAKQYDLDFVSLQIGSGYGKAYFLARAKKTTGIATINQQVLGAFPLISPPLDKQRRMAADLKSQLAAVDAAETAAAIQLAEIERLPARLLAQAFGET